MKLRLIKIRDSLADSFWFLPTLMAILAVGIAFGLVALDHAIGAKWVEDAAWIWSGGPQGARSVLSVVAGSVMTVTSIVFSLTISTLAQTSSHYGPRVLRNFTSDRGVQFTLGTFVATFIYCLFVLRTIRSVEEAAFVPYLAVNVGIVLAVASLGVLLFFIHKVSQSIQAENLVAAVGNDFQKYLAILFPERIGDAEIAEVPDDTYWQHAREVEAKTNGYVQRVDDEQLMRLASKHDLQIRIEKRPGDFVSHHVLLKAVPPSRVDAVIEKVLSECFVIGQHRTPHQDILFSLQQLTEIATRALSPGANEPSTALVCIDWIGVSLRSIVRRQMPSPLRQDDEGALRVVAYPVTFEEMAQEILEPLRWYGASSPDVALALLKMIAEVAPDVRRTSDRETLAFQVRLITEDALQTSNSEDKRRIEAQSQECLRALGTPR